MLDWPQGDFAVPWFHKPEHPLAIKKGGEGG